MEKRLLAFSAFFLILSVGNYMRLTGNENIRPIQFISIFTIGIFSGVFVALLIYLFKKKKRENL